MRRSDGLFERFLDMLGGLARQPRARPGRHAGGRVRTPRAVTQARRKRERRARRYARLCASGRKHRFRGVRP